VRQSAPTELHLPWIAGWTICSCAAEGRDHGLSTMPGVPAQEQVIGPLDRPFPHTHPGRATTGSDRNNSGTCVRRNQAGCAWSRAKTNYQDWLRRAKPLPAAARDSAILQGVTPCARAARGRRITATCGFSAPPPIGERPRAPTTLPHDG